MGPNTDDLGLEAAGGKVDARSVELPVRAGFERGI